jgi:tripartite-type tricarboxylate transporter receptor subunit TctC
MCAGTFIEFLARPSAFIFVCSALWAAAASAAQTYPVRPIRVVVASVTGSAPDIIARHLGAKLTEGWGQQIVVDTRPGASGMIGAETTARAAPDGYTLWLGTQTQLISTLLHGKFAMSREFAPVGFVATTTFVLVASAAIPAKTMAEFIDLAKARPGQLLYASGGDGSSGHLCVELLKRMTGIDLVHVPYKSSPLAMTDLFSGQVHLGCVAAPGAPAYLKSGKARALAITSPVRTPLAPGMAPLAETVPGYDLTGWYGLLAPRGTPADIVSRINTAVTKVLKDPAFQERLLAIGAEAAPSTPADFGAMLRKETARWDQILKEAGIRPAQ